MLYAIYRGDTFVDVGTAKELARKNNIKISTVYFYASPYYHNLVKNKINRRIVYRVGVEEKWLN